MSKGSEDQEQTPEQKGYKAARGALPYTGEKSEVTIRRIREKMTWGDIYNLAVRRGIDNGAAAWMADQWEKRQDKK